MDYGEYTHQYQQGNTWKDNIDGHALQVKQKKAQMVKLCAILLSK